MPNEGAALDDIQDKDLVFNIGDQLFLETVLCTIRGATIAYASFRKRTRNNREKEIEEEINNIEKLPYISDESKQNLLTLKDELIEYRKEKIKGVMVRTKARWIEDGEKPSKYFCNLEKRRHVNKTITKLTVDDGSIIQSQEGILNEVLNFYKQLYSSRDDSIENIDLNVKLDNESIPKLSEDEQNKCDADITLSEAANFLRKMKMINPQDLMVLPLNFSNFFGRI